MKQSPVKKAQVSTIDMLIAVLIFTILITVIMIFWSNYNEKLLSRLEHEAIFSTAIEITDNFVKTPGRPSDWNKDNVKVIGFAFSDRNISEEKVQEFCNVSYEEARQLLINLPYHFYFSIEDTECGMEPSEGARKVVSLTRPVIYKNETTLLKFSLWR